jgi:hypothetical protein
MEKYVYLVLDINFKVMDDISVMGTYASLDVAFAEACAEVKSVNGKNILFHNYFTKGEECVLARLTNNNSLGSDYGISYNSEYGNYPCCKMITPQKVKL